MSIQMDSLLKRLLEIKRQQLGLAPLEGDSSEDEESEEHEDSGRIPLTEEDFKGPKIYSWEKSEEDGGTGTKEVDIRYPLIPSNPDDDEQVFAWAHISYIPEEEEVVYQLHEPELSESNRENLDRLEERLKESIDVDFGEMKRDEAKDFLRSRVSHILDRDDFSLSPDDRDIVQYYAFRNFVGLGKIEALMNDRYIEDISCDGTGVPVYIYHRNADVGSVPTDVVFKDKDNLDSFVRKLSQRCGRSISMAEPLLDGSLPDGSRVQATLSTDIARRGSNFTIRRFTEEPLTPIDIMEFGTVDAKMLAYLWLAIENGKSMLIAGPTASGKTTLLNAMSLFIPPQLKVVSIEDTPELRLPHPNWVPEVARSGFGFGENTTGQVSLDDLLEESLRQRPDYIIVGEVRGEEAYILFQQIATGHPGLSTIHASSMTKVMDRLTTKPINLPPSLIENLDIIIFAKRVRRGGQYLRRVDAIYELEGYDKHEDEPLVNQLFNWNANSDSFDYSPDGSRVLANISEERGIDPRKLQSEITRRQKVIEWMQKAGIDHYTEVGQIASQYYRYPERVLSKIGEDD